MSKPTILIVEDDADVRSALSEALTTADFKVLESQDGMNGLEQAKTHQPNLIITDINMPKLSGHDLIAAIRELNDWGKTVPVIFLSSFSDMQNLATSLEHGSKHYFVKGEHPLAEIVKKCQALI